MHAPTLTQKEFRRLKGRLTRRENAVKKADNDTDRLQAAKDLVREVDYAMGIFEEKGYPDDWYRWQVASDDVSFILHAGGRARV